MGCFRSMGLPPIQIGDIPISDATGEGVTMKGKGIFIRLLDNVESYICQFLLSFFIILLFVQIISREVFSVNISWGEELARFSFVWFVFFRLSWRFRIWPVLAIFTIPSIFYISQSFIYTERNIILLLSVFVFFFFRFHKCQKKCYLYASLTAAFLSLFYKETVFLIILGFSLTRGVYLYTRTRR